MDLSSLPAHHARYRPEATAVVFEQERLDYRSFSARIDRVATLLPELTTLTPGRILLIDGGEPPWGDYAARPLP